MESDVVAYRGIQILDSIVKLIKIIVEKVQDFWKKDRNSFDKLVLHQKFRLVKMQLHLFKDIALL